MPISLLLITSYNNNESLRALRGANIISTSLDWLNTGEINEQIFQQILPFAVRQVIIKERHRCIIHWLMYNSDLTAASMHK